MGVGPEYRNAARPELGRLPFGGEPHDRYRQRRQIASSAEGRPKETPATDRSHATGFRPRCHPSGKKIWGRLGNASDNPVFLRGYAANGCVWDAALQFTTRGRRLLWMTRGVAPGAAFGSVRRPVARPEREPRPTGRGLGNPPSSAQNYFLL
jgi:hypothetical protein